MFRNLLKRIPESTLDHAWRATSVGLGVGCLAYVLTIGGDKYYFDPYKGIDY